MKLAFIGPGTMGFGMAMNLAAGEEECLVIGRSAEKLKAFAERGIPVSTDPHAAEGSDLIFLCLPSAKAVEEMMLGEAAPPFHDGQIIVDCSTIDYRKARALAAHFAEEGVCYLDSPVSGHRGRALSGGLGIFCGGEETAFEKAKPYLSRMGQALYMGSSGAGQLTKMINNCLLNASAAAFCELMPLGVSLGLNAGQLAQAIMSGSGSSYAAKTLLPKILAGDFSHDFTMEAAKKDVVSLKELLTEKDVRLPVFEGMREDYERALAEGCGQLYKGAMILPYEKMFGAACRKEYESKEGKSNA